MRGLANCSFNVFSSILGKFVGVGIVSYCSPSNAGTEKNKNKEIENKFFPNI